MKLTTRIMIKLKNSNFDDTKNLNCVETKKSKSNKTQKLKL